MSNENLPFRGKLWQFFLEISHKREFYEVEEKMKLTTFDGNFSDTDTDMKRDILVQAPDITDSKGHGGIQKVIMQ